MIDHLFDRYSKTVQRFVLVVHPSFEAAVREHVDAGRTVLSTSSMPSQPKPTGMLDAILLALGRCAADARRACLDYVVRSDRRASGHRSRTLSRMSEEHPDAAAIFPTSRQAPPYIHLDRDAEGRITAHPSPSRGRRRCLTSAKATWACSRCRPDAYFSLLPQFGREVDAGERRRASEIFCRSCRGWPCADTRC